MCVICRVANFEHKGNQYKETEKVDNVEAQAVRQSQVLERRFG